LDDRYSKSCSNADDFAIIFFILTGTVLAGYSVKPDNELFILASIALGSGVGVLFLAAARSKLLANNSNLERAEKELREEIAKLQAMDPPSE
jgi:uncharacterized membrane protein